MHIFKNIVFSSYTVLQLFNYKIYNNNHILNRKL